MVEYYQDPSLETPDTHHLEECQCLHTLGHIGRWDGQVSTDLGPAWGGLSFLHGFSTRSPLAREEALGQFYACQTLSLHRPGNMDSVAIVKEVLANLLALSLGSPGWKNLGTRLNYMKTISKLHSLGTIQECPTLTLPRDAHPTLSSRKFLKSFIFWLLGMFLPLQHWHRLHKFVL